MAERRLRLIVSVDVEDWPQSVWDRSLPISEYCADNVRRFLELATRGDPARVTFFVLGKFAEKHPNVVREIHEAGHEIACHGYGHEEIFRQTRAAFAEDIERSTAILTDITGVAPRGYRAPGFSIVGETLWALDVLAQHGYVYDSSIFPIRKARYGIATFPTETVRIELASGLSILEFPLTTVTWSRRRLPISGGGYARLLPRMLLAKLLASQAQNRSLPPVFYCHPYELDEQELKSMSLTIPWRVRLHQGLGRRTFATKLEMLLRRFECVPFSAVLDEANDVPAINCQPYMLTPGSVRRPCTLQFARSDV